MKILNLYAGIGGNRMLWGDEHEITAVENVPEVAAIYQHLFPKDTVVIDDAHEYLRKHFREFDFIWSSPPCPTHSVLQMTQIQLFNQKPILEVLKPIRFQEKIQPSKPQKTAKNKKS